MFENQIIVVTGGSSGIGEAAVDRFCRGGAKRVFNLDVAQPSASHPNARYVKCDVKDRGGVRAAVGNIIKECGSVDVLFANAGVFALGDIEETPDEVFDEIVATNLHGTWVVIQAVIPAMKKQGRGAIVINGSDQTFVGRKKSAAYGLTKGALGQLTKSLALDYAEHGIRVNCVCPAAVDTPLCRKAIEEWAKKYGGDVIQLIAEEHKLQPLGRMATAEEVANVVAFVASKEASNITGALISADGGYTAQ